MFLFGCGNGIIITMKVQTIRQLLRQRPFRPFRIVMSSGETYKVSDPDWAFLTRKDILVGVGPTWEGIPEEARICSLSQVAAIEPLDFPPTWPAT